MTSSSKATLNKVSEDFRLTVALEKFNSQMRLNFENFNGHGKVSMDFKQITWPNQINLHKNNNLHKKVSDLLDTDTASLDMDHLDLQLNSLDKDLLDSRQKANWYPINFYENIN